MQGTRIRVRGQVQGVGFRPFVWRLARERGLCGDVRNDAEGVLIHLAGAVGDFAQALRDQAPPLARVDQVEVAAYRFAAAPEAFTIIASGERGAQTCVTPDAATCAACCEEVFAQGRRHGYAFTNCTHCGPRYSILKALPYDRAGTTMAGFALCAACRADYGDPADRRFHAQPIACPECGPRLWYEGAGEGDPIALALRDLRAGKIIAIKGLGGFHLACDARNGAALAALRARKHRPAKPFALMCRAADLGGMVEAGAAEMALLRDPSAPVVLMRRAAGCDLPDLVAPGISDLGVMLPYTPLHHLLLEGFGGVLVMTSGNASGAPQEIENSGARERLAGLADGFLMHDREIARRLDDSVVRAVPQMVLRHARGRVPSTLALPEGFAGAAQVVAYGGQTKGAICLIKDGQALLGHHLGDLDAPETREAFGAADADYAALFDHAPRAVAVDLHRDFYASRFGAERAAREGIALIEVQHHHAHLAACLAENGWARGAGQVAGIVLDGLGLGSDGTVWGGEILLGDYNGFTRQAWLRPAALIGGDRAQSEPWRNGLVRLDQAGLGDWADAIFADQPRDLARQAAAKGVNSPPSSSAGRLFDAVASVLGICVPRQSYEGEAAMRLEALAGQNRGQNRGADVPDWGLVWSGAELDPAPMFHAIRRDLGAGVPPARIAWQVHAAIALAFAEQARELVRSGAARAVALSGGCFQNAVLLEMTQAALAGCPVLVHRHTPANDGGLALGQAVIAAARLCEGSESG